MLNKFINLIFSGLSLTFIIKCLIAIFMGGFVSTSLILSGQNWAKTFTNVTTFCILPLIGLVISVEED